LSSVIIFNICCALYYYEYCFHYTATVKTQLSDATLCPGEAAVLTFAVDRNGTTINDVDVVWEQIRVGSATTKLSTRGYFNITTTISEDILTSTLIITGATDSNTLGISVYRCVVNDVIYSRSVSLHVSPGNDSLNMYVYTL